MKERLPNIQDLETVVYVYANIRGLGKALVEGKILDHQEDLGRFVCGFNKKYPLFDFVDAGNGKECSDAKLKRKWFRLFPWSSVFLNAHYLASRSLRAIHPQCSMQTYYIWWLG